MAEAVPPPSPPYSGDSNSVPGEPPNPAKKRKATANASKRPHVINMSSSSSEETKDTASSEPNKEVEMPDDVVYQDLDEYEFLHGFNPAVDRQHMRRFSLPYLHVGIGNKGGWENRFRWLRFKFKIANPALVPPEQEEQFLLWKKMFKRDPPP